MNVFMRDSIGGLRGAGLLVVAFFLLSAVIILF
jgi:hypothetical protein